MADKNGDSHAEARGTRGEKDLDSVTGDVIEVAIQIHRELGPGLLETVYEMVLARKLEALGYLVQKQFPVSFVYDGYEYVDGFRVDLLVDERVVVELKSVEKPHPSHPKQVLTYLRLLNLEVGLLINFGAPLLKDGLQRIVNDYHPTASPRLRVNETPRR